MATLNPPSLLRPYCALTLGIVGSIVCTSSLQAAQWRLGSGINTDLSHTRTVVTDGGETTSSDVVWGINPYLSLNGQGKSLDVNARLGIDHTSNLDDGGTTTRPAASVDGELTVIERRAWVTMGANVARQRESTNGSAEDFLVNLDSDSTQVDFSVSERGTAPLGSTSQVNGAHRFSTTHVSGDAEQTSQTHLLNLSTISILRNAGSLVFTDLNYQYTDIENSGIFETGEMALGIGMPVGPTKVKLSIGQEWYDLMLEQQDLDGFYWAVGMTWQPVSTFQFEAGYGERGYGRTPFMRASLLGRRNTLSLSWSRGLAFQRGSQSDVLFPDTISMSDSDDIGTTDIGAASEPDIFGEQSSLSPFIDEVRSIDEEIRLDHEFRGRVSTLSTGIGWVKRSSIVDSDSSESTLSFATVELTRIIGQSVSARAGVRVAESKVDGSTEKEQVNRVRIALMWRF